MCKNNKRLLSLTICLMFCLIPCSANANVHEDEVIYSAEEITDVETLQYRIDNGISEEGVIAKEKLNLSMGTTSENVKIEQSEPTIQLLSTARNAEGGIDNVYAAKAIGTISYREGIPNSDGGYLWSYAAQYVTTLYYRESTYGLSTTADLIRATTEITQHEDKSFDITLMRLYSGGTGMAYDRNGSSYGAKDTFRTTTKTGSLTTGDIVSCNDYEEYYMLTVDDTYSGIGANCYFEAVRGGYTHSAQGKSVTIGTIG